MISILREVYQFKIQLMEVKPPIWRRFLISNSSSLEDFHHTIQITMGWTNSHLHQFICGEDRYGASLPSEFAMNWDDNLRDETNFKIKDILKDEGSSILYEYDFGDSWEHKIILEKIVPYEKGQFLPFCMKGKRGCPPEDVGGVWGYSDFLEKWNDDKHPENEEVREWAGDYFEPEIFDQSETNQILLEAFTKN
ncbi:plasmid pRiA4b ORF-3 family protein [Shewanella surugensis]|uniref:Plasmid pRiA4b ORF-3 family protein n=1 Tax=Shewanella surugensis TaxID=212020 RepID=A0ABT0LJY7_9GAMM|nr:plasmid pRiA4b ORF-3 family protein [Shewanella surugensis]MCL1128009.1 plasmid pRiA4b ORF-3 family protein [Shewanella surugensis]